MAPSSCTRQVIERIQQGRRNESLIAVDATGSPCRSKGGGAAGRPPPGDMSAAECPGGLIPHQPQQGVFLGKSYIRHKIADRTLQEPAMLQAYRQHAAERAALGIPPLPLDAKQTAALIELIKAPPAGEDTAFLLDLLTHRVPPGVDDAAKVKASVLAAVA